MYVTRIGYLEPLQLNQLWIYNLLKKRKKNLVNRKHHRLNKQLYSLKKGQGQQQQQQQMLRPISLFSFSFTSTLIFQHPLIVLGIWTTTYLVLIEPYAEFNSLYHLTGILCGTVVAETLRRVNRWERTPSIFKSIALFVVHMIVGLGSCKFLDYMSESRPVLSEWQFGWHHLAVSLILDANLLSFDQFVIKTLFDVSISGVLTLEHSLIPSGFYATKHETVAQVMDRKEGSLIMVVMLISVALMVVYAGLVQKAFGKSKNKNEKKEQDKKNK